MDVAAPRFAISTVDDATVVFHPARLVIEQGDWVRWMHTSTAQFPVFHTTMHGVKNALGGCDPLGLWSAPLLPPDFPQFTRRFLEPPQALPYCCEPHTFLNMLGEVVVTDPIPLTVTGNSGVLTLDWSGGSGLYQVFRSDTPKFVGAGTSAFAPVVGDTGTTYTDMTQPDPGKALFYLVMNKF
jgi:plastocyanin